MVSGIAVHTDGTPERVDVTLVGAAKCSAVLESGTTCVAEIRYRGALCVAWPVRGDPPCEAAIALPDPALIPETCPVLVWPLASSARILGVTAFTQRSADVDDLCSSCWLEAICENERPRKARAKRVSRKKKPVPTEEEEATADATDSGCEGTATEDEGDVYPEDDEDGGEEEGTVASDVVEDEDVEEEDVEDEDVEEDDEDAEEEDADEDV